MGPRGTYRFCSSPQLEVWEAVSVCSVCIWVSAMGGCGPSVWILVSVWRMRLMDTIFSSVSTCSLALQQRVATSHPATCPAHVNFRATCTTPCFPTLVAHDPWGLPLYVRGENGHCFQLCPNLVSHSHKSCWLSRVALMQENPRTHDPLLFCRTRFPWSQSPQQLEIIYFPYLGEAQTRY